MQNTIDEIKKREYISNFVAIKNIKRKLKTLLKDEEYLSMEKFIQHGTTNCILHSIAVTHYSLMFASKLHIKVNYNSLVRGALLHDYFLYDFGKKNSMQEINYDLRINVREAAGMNNFETSPISEEEFLK